MAIDLAAQIVRQIAHRVVPSWSLVERDGRRREALEHAALVFNRFSSLAWFRGDQLALVHSIFKVLNLAEEAADVSDMVHGSGAMAVLCGLVGWHRAATFYCERAVQLAEDSRNPSNAARAHVNAAVYAIGSALWRDAEVHVSRSLDLHLRLGDRQHWEGSRALNGYLHLARGEFPQAIACFDEVYQSARNGRAQSRVWARSGHVAAQIPTSVVSASVIEDLIGDLPRLALELPDTAEAMTAHGLIAQAHLRAGHIGRAIDSAELGLRLLVERKPGAVYYAFWGMAALAETCLALWEANTGKRSERDHRNRAEEACRILRAFGRMIALARPRAALCDGWFAALAGRHGVAVHRLHHGMESAVRLQMPFEQALLHVELARRSNTEAERVHHATAAARLLKAQGATAELERFGLSTPAHLPRDVAFEDEPRKAAS
jgi:hypothetical protein